MKIEELDLYEVSLVLHPANPHTRIISVEQEQS